MAEILTQPTFWLLGVAGSSLISITLSVLVGDVIREKLSNFMSRIHRPPRRGVQGKWIAEFDDRSDPDDTRYPVREEMEVQRLMGLVVGRRTDFPKRRGERETRIHKALAIRIKGHFIGDFLVGTWYHPSSSSRAIGAFQLVMHESGNRMDGVWIKYREGSGIVSGPWIWKRADVEALSAAA